jgi:hypothetical protein
MSSVIVLKLPSRLAERLALVEPKFRLVAGLLTVEVAVDECFVDVVCDVVVDVDVNVFDNDVEVFDVGAAVEAVGVAWTI